MTSSAEKSPRKQEVVGLLRRGSTEICRETEIKAPPEVTSRLAKDHVNFVQTDDLLLKIIVEAIVVVIERGVKN